VSNINYLGINENFPVAGEDNDTQVFRDNFDTIKTSLQTAKDEITDLEANAARLDIDNDFNRTIISRAVMQDNFERKYDHGVTETPVIVDFENGSYQIFRFNANTSVEFQNFPDSNTLPISVGKVTLELYGSIDPFTNLGRTITFVTSGGTVLKKNSSFPDPLVLTSQELAAGGGNPIIVEVWRHKSDRIFLNYIGQFSS